MKKSIVIKGMLLVLLGVIVVSLTGCSSEETQEIKNNENIQSQANVVEKNEESDNKQSSNSSSDSTKKESETVSENSNKENTVKKSETTEDSNSQLSKEEIAKETYLKQLKEEANQEFGKLLDYKVEKVEIVDFEEVKKFSPDIQEYYPGVKDSDIFATITYSVKPEGDKDSEGYNFWLAGNGEASGEWIKNKVVNVWMVEKNGQYTVESSGTGW